MMDEGFTPLGSEAFAPLQFQFFTRLFKWQTRVIPYAETRDVFVGHFCDLCRTMRYEENKNEIAKRPFQVIR